MLPGDVIILKGLIHSEWIYLSQDDTGVEHSGRAGWCCYSRVLTSASEAVAFNLEMVDIVQSARLTGSRSRAREIYVALCSRCKI